MTVRRSRIAAGGLALASIVAAALVLLWPLHVNGVHGSALRPRYDRYITFTTFEPYPYESVTESQRRTLAASAFTAPRDAVAHRRYVGYGLLAGGFALAVGLATTMVVQRRRRAS